MFIRTILQLFLWALLASSSSGRFSKNDVYNKVQLVERLLYDIERYGDDYEDRTAGNEDNSNYDYEPSLKNRYLDNEYRGSRYSDNKNDIFLQNRFYKFPRDQEDNRARIGCKVQSKYRYSDLDVQLLFDTLNRMTSWFAKNYAQIIVDGLFGMRSAEGFLQRALQSVKPSHRLYNKLFQLHQHLHKSSEKIYSILKNKNETYARSFLKVLDRPFHFMRPWRKIDTNLVWKYHSDATMDEQESDRCVCLLLGSGKYKKNCVVTKKCFREETQLYSKGYLLTHQALYFMAGEAHGCKSQLVKATGGKKNLDHYYDMFGSNICSEMTQKEITKDNRDIIAEAGMIGGSLGFVECLRMDYMRKALNWVGKEGCIAQSFRSYQRNSKRVDAMIGTCSQHETAVTLGFLAIHLNFIVDPPACNLVGCKH